MRAAGIGGSALVLGDRYGAQVVGLTLSPVQAARAQARAEEAGLSDCVTFQVADVLHTPL
jgi:tocopherol O-methyltransferase